MLFVADLLTEMCYLPWSRNGKIPKQIKMNDPIFGIFIRWKDLPELLYVHNSLSIQKTIY
jgi:hypothetical protein